MDRTKTAVESDFKHFLEEHPDRVEPLRYENESIDRVISHKVISDTKLYGIMLKGCHRVTIEQCCIMNTGQPGIVLERCSDITIRNCLFTDNASAVYAINSERINVYNCTCTYIRGPKPRGQFVQFNKVHLGSIENCLVINSEDDPNEDIEDIINLYQSSGSQEEPIIVSGNWILNGGSSKSGGGILLGDNFGAYQHVRDNVLINPGQYGIGVAAYYGKEFRVENNVIISEGGPVNNVGLYVYPQKKQIPKDDELPGPPSGITVEDNMLYYYNRNGIRNDMWVDKIATVDSLHNIGIEMNGDDFPADMISVGYQEEFFQDKEPEKYTSLVHFPAGVKISQEGNDQARITLREGSHVESLKVLDENTALLYYKV